MARKDAISQYATDDIGVAVQERGVLVDPDNEEVSISITRLSDQVLIIDEELATRQDLGFYSYTLNFEVTAQQGDYSAKWTYEINGEQRVFGYDFTVVKPQDFWDSLNPKQKEVIDGIYFKLSDGFDSTVGGPYLWELPQSSFGVETIARLTIVDGMNAINYEGPKAFRSPYAFGSMGYGTAQIPPNWYGLVQKAGFYETLKHLARSYLEIPMAVNVPTAYEDRTRYSQMWMQMAEKEGEELLRQIHMIKRAMAFGVKTRAQLIAGGIFPISYLNPARPRWPYVLTRFY